MSEKVQKGGENCEEIDIQVNERPAGGFQVPNIQVKSSKIRTENETPEMAFSPKDGEDANSTTSTAKPAGFSDSSAAQTPSDFTSEKQNSLNNKQSPNNT